MKAGGQHVQMEAVLNETEICENLKTEIVELVFERNRLSSENIELKAEINHIYKMKAFNQIHDVLYSGKF